MTGRPATASAIASVRPPPSCPWRGPAVTPGTTAQTVSRGVQHQGAMGKPTTTDPAPVGLIRRNPAAPEVRMNVPPRAPTPAAARVGAGPTRGRGPVGPTRMAEAAAPGPLITVALRPATTARRAALTPATTAGAAVPATIRVLVESSFVSAAGRMAGPQPVGRAARRAGDPAAAEPVRPQADRVGAARVRRADPQAADLRGVARAAAAHSPAVAAAVPAAATAAGPAAAPVPAPAEPEVRPVGAPAGHRGSGLRPRVRP